MSAVSAIERTAEYEKFMKDLKAFHDLKGYGPYNHTNDTF